MSRHIRGTHQPRTRVIGAQGNKVTLELMNASIIYMTSLWEGIHQDV